MPQLSPLNWAFISLIILMLIFLTKVFFSFLTNKKMKFLSNYVFLKTFQKWNW
uniref:ATP synthase subunit 8 n=1 Tax=Loxocorone allax TaxID=393181 RepID=B1B1V8_LOXAA|nr:ATP synthase F0 subunit 8 [Loxocorone allax]BAG12575.1 ATP synthase subunit 8 [Loxocorone allax]